MTASWKQQVEGPGQGHGPSALAPPAAACHLSHCTEVPGVLICPVAPWSFLGMSGWPGGPGMAVIDNHAATASVVSDGQSWCLGLAKSDLKQSVCVCVSVFAWVCWGGGHRQKWPDLTLFRQASVVQAAKNCPPRSRYGGGRAADRPFLAGSAHT